MDGMDLGLIMPDAALSHAEGRADAAARPMDEDAFRAFYDRTARPLWAYLARITGDPSVADDLLQEAYYRFVRAGAVHESEAHRRNSLYHTATNLVRDRARRNAVAFHVPIAEDGGKDLLAAETGAFDRFQHRTDLGRALSRLEPRQRQMLWLAYAEGSTHHEIAEVLGLKVANVRTTLFRARRKLAKLLRGPATDPGRGYGHG